MSDARPPSLAQPPSWAGIEPPPPGTWCRACHGQRWWTGRQQPAGWRCMTCHPPDHLPPEAVRREGQEEMAPRPAAGTEGEADERIAIGAGDRSR